MKLLHEQEGAVQLVDFTVLIKQGAISDPVTKLGLTRLLARLIRMGPKGMSAEAFEDQLALMGARFGASVSTGSLRFSGVVLARHFERFVSLLGRCLLEPAFRPSDLAKAKRETLASIDSWLDDDRDLAARAFSKLVFGEHPYQRPIIGTPSTLRKIQKADLLAHHKKLFVDSNVIVGAAGAVTDKAFRKIVKSTLTFPKGSTAKLRLADPKPRKGRHVTIVHKEQRTQTQMFIGTLGCKAKDKGNYALTVADTAFGGSFSGRLMNEVRSKRGWSYGASSTFSVPKRRGSWRMWTHPSVEHAGDCAELQLQLLEDWVSNGLKAKEVNFAKRSLINGRCFDIETPSQRLAIRMSLATHSLPPSLMMEYQDRIAAVTRQTANDAVTHYISSKDVAIALVADANLVEGRFRSLPDIETVSVVPFEDL